MKQRTLQKLIEQARRVRDDAAVRMAGANRDAEQAQQTLNVLCGYLNQHLSPDKANDQTPTDSPTLQVRERFTQRLNLAIDEQTRQRDNLHEVTEQRRSELIDRQKRLLAFETLHARRESAQQSREQRRDQKRTDEMAAQALQRRLRGS
ncbi:MAG: flagellar export protein FliJ [Burkholderiales bacterium]|nr:flagellar export protein FliJ [Burkholderiales bacterium]